MISRSQKRLVSIVLLVLSLIAALAVWSRFHEPQAVGKPLSYWIRHLRIGVKVIHNPPQGGASNGPAFTVMLPNLTEQEMACLILSTNVQTIGRNAAMFQFFPSWPDRIMFFSSDELNEDPAGRVIKSMGAAALPCLQAGLHRRESRTSKFILRWVWPRLPMRLQEWIGTPVHPVHMRANSAFALGLLGAAASPAVPELQKLLKHDENGLVRSVALEALHRIQPDIAGRFYPELFRQTQPEPRILPSGITNSSDPFSPKLSL